MPNPLSPVLRLLWDGRGLAEVGLLPWKWGELRRQPRGTGQPVMVLPGFGTGDATTVVLRSYLNWLGYRASGWGLGINRGDVAKLLPPVLKRVRALCEETGQPLHLVGWSLGGVIAREVAREQPQLVASLITMGSPVIGGAKYTLFRDYFAARGVDLDAVELRIAERNQRLIDVPITVLCSRNDEVVDWEACRDDVNAQAVHIEVKTTHLGLGVSPEVLKIVAQRLASP